MKVQRREVTDLITRDGETAVLVDGMLVRLSELGATMYALTELPVEIGLLARTLEAHFGSPEEGSSLDATKETVAELVRHRVVRVLP